jgi:hypothetical protein
MEKELNDNLNPTCVALKDLINELKSKKVSILQVANDNTGVISLNEKDCLWIEQLSYASLINTEEQPFLTSNSRLTFDFVYVQSQIIRTYLLLCRINYRHIHHKYQCHTRRIQTTDTENLDLDEKYLIPLTNEQLENEWNHLKDMLLDKLYHAYSFLRQIALTLQNYQDDKSSIYLSEFVRMTDHDNDLYQRLKQHEIKDFQLCHIDHVLKLYAQSISGFQHLFTDVHHLLRVPIDVQLNNELIQNFDKNIINIDYNNDIDKIHSTIQIITEFLNDLKTTEDTLYQQSTQSLGQICKLLAIENSILSSIPEGIKCENYVALNIHLIRTRSVLQERKVNLEEKETKLWDEKFNSDESPDKQGNRFYQYLTSVDEEQDNKESNDWILPLSDAEGLNNENNLLLFEDHPSHQRQTTSEDPLIEYSSLMELNIKLVSCTSSIFIQQIQKYREEPQVESTPVTKAQKYIIVHPDEKPISYLWKSEKFFEQLQKLFVEKKYDYDSLVVVDKNEMFVDFTKNVYSPSSKTILKYRIIEKQLLFQIQFQYGTRVYEYLTTSKSSISVIIYRFIDDNHLQSLSPDICLCFFDEYGKCIDDGTIDDLRKTDSRIILIKVTEEPPNTNTLCELTLQSEKGNEKNKLSS